MLVMKRRAGESFTIGDDIEIEVLEVSGTRVKLGIVAPDSALIVRKEALVTREENITAAQAMEPNTLAALVRQLSKSKHRVATINNDHLAKSNSPLIK